MMAALMYHRVGTGKHSNSLEMLKSHFTYLKDRFPVLLPGETLPKKKISVCLTFDDATFDFYHTVYPLLRELKMRALLGVPAGYIVEKTTLSTQERLSTPYPLMMQEGIYEKKVPFCTWEELKEMASSGYVEIASHSYFHCNLTFSFVDLEREVLLSKQCLEEKLGVEINSFIYPFGKTNPRVHEKVAEHYKYAFRIGSGINFGWGKGKTPLMRLQGDNLSSPTSPLSFWNLTKAFCKTLFTSL